MRKVVKLSQGVSNIKQGKARQGPLKLLGGTFRLRPAHHQEFNVEVWDDEERGAEIGTGDGQGNVSEWFIKDVQGEWFKIGSVLQPQLVINGDVKGADINDGSVNTEQRSLVFNNRSCGSTTSPRSTNLICPFAINNTLSGFKSR